MKTLKAMSVRDFKKWVTDDLGGTFDKDIIFYKGRKILTPDLKRKDILHGWVRDTYKRFQAIDALEQEQQQALGAVADGAAARQRLRGRVQIATSVSGGPP